MKRIWYCTLILSSCLLCSLTTDAGSPLYAGSETRALVSYFKGSVVISRPNEKGREAKLFDQLGEGAMIETGASSQVVLLFTTGERLSVEENTQAIIEKGALKPLRGKIVPLARAVGIPHISAITQTELPGRIQTAIRIRMNKEKSNFTYYPFSGVCIQADHASVSFPPQQHGSNYLIELEEAAGKKIFSLTTDKTTVTIPMGILKPANDYYWSAKVIEMKKKKLLVHAFFNTLPEKESSLRQSLLTQYEAGKSPDSLVLLILSDCHMGLLKEACEEIAFFSDSEAITRSLRDILIDFDCATL